MTTIIMRIIKPRNQRGEGVISAAIAILIMAVLGVALWFGLNATLNNAQNNVNNQVCTIGGGDGC